MDKPDIRPVPNWGTSRIRVIEACRETQKTVTIAHVNGVLIQPHWRSHDELIKQQVA